MEIVLWIMWLAFKPYIYAMGGMVFIAMAISASAGACYGLLHPEHGQPTPQRA